MHPLIVEAVRILSPFIVTTHSLTDDELLIEVAMLPQSFYVFLAESGTELNAKVEYNGRNGSSRVSITVSS